jgi:quercetin dioxygenase-like cupin family protein
MAENAIDRSFGQGGFPQQDVTRVNPSEEAIRIGPLGIRFLLSGGDSNGSVSVFELLVPAGQKLPAPSHKNDAYEETLYGIEGVLTWTVDGTPVDIGPGQALCIPRGAAHRFDNLGGKDAKQFVAITPAIMAPHISAKQPRSSTPPLAARPTARKWRRSCGVTG